MTPPARILVVITRRIGDVLLTTPLIRTLKRAWPSSAIDVLVFAGTEGVLSGNPDVHRVIRVPQRPRGIEHCMLLTRLARRYDLAISAVPGDRPTLYAWLAGRRRCGLYLDEPAHRWKKRLLHRRVIFDDLNTHTVLMHLELANALDLAPSFEVVTPSDPDAHAALKQALPLDWAQPYAVVHTYPQFNYKMWHPESWTATLSELGRRGLRVVLTGGPDQEEVHYVQGIANKSEHVANLAGKLTLAQASTLLANAKLYIGPDTALTHMAAATGVPVVALFGPGNPVKWGPWPAGYEGRTSPWRRHGTQRVNNVRLVQAPGACVPCLKEGCDRNIVSHSDCLHTLSPRQVLHEVAMILEEKDIRDGTKTTTLH